MKFHFQSSEWENVIRSRYATEEEYGKAVAKSVINDLQQLLVTLLRYAFRVKKDDRQYRIGEEYEELFTVRFYKKTDKWSIVFLAEMDTELPFEPLRIKSDENTS